MNLAKELHAITTPDERPIITTPLFEKLCSDEDVMNLSDTKWATFAMIVLPLRPYIGRLVYGSLVYPEMYHRNNLTTDIHHFLRQVFQRCKPLSWKDPQLKRVFYEEVKDGEGVHFISSWKRHAKCQCLTLSICVKRGGEA
jgi:hypothetical protein